VNETQLAAALVALGCPADRAADMAAQLAKRAGQLQAERGWTEPQALTHLLRLMARGWSAQARGAAPGPPAA
jgi:hypothetical protein